ncbi:MAG: GNAT family N-acetyltransferase [Anaerolineales bacterium]
MIQHVDTAVRLVNSSDKQKIANLIHFETNVHRHLDWLNPIDWIGKQPFLTIEKGHNLLAAMACPPGPQGIAWIRLFAAATVISPEKAWKALWNHAYEQLSNMMVTKVAVIPLHDWFHELVIQNGFEPTIQVITLLWKKQKLPLSKRDKDITIRSMRHDDLDDVASLDYRAFDPMWCNSQSSLETAFSQAAIATVVELKGLLIGYQISTSNQLGGHLARLAVHPEFQGAGIGYSLLCDVLQQFDKRGAHRVSVNTQGDNIISLGLYEKAGFEKTGEEYQVFELNLTSSE